mmetsp:Transcript_34920/g.104167  ORF Transcript_34920/g.104167 Transcript_34920/m.104167 type:complete len:80 (-) Transcript_34920:1042-1281(-)
MCWLWRQASASKTRRARRQAMSTCVSCVSSLRDDLHSHLTVDKLSERQRTHSSEGVVDEGELNCDFRRDEIEAIEGETP